MNWETSRRNFLRAGAAVAGAGLLQACGSQGSKPPSTQTGAKPVLPKKPQVQRSGNNVLRVVAPSGFAADRGRIEAGLTRLYNAGFTVTNQEAAYRRYQRFAGSDRERLADFQEVASGRVATPKVLMGLRGGYGAVRLLPDIDLASLGARMREQGTLFFGFSDVCAIQLGLLAKSGMCSFAGPMVYSEFGKYTPSVYTMDSFISGSANPTNTISVSTIQRRSRNLEGTLWGGNLSVLASLAGSPYMPDIKDGILFLEDVGEPPYKLDRLLQQLRLQGVLRRVKGILVGTFAGCIDDETGETYDVASHVYDYAMEGRAERAPKPVVASIPLGHGAPHKALPMGALVTLSENVLTWERP